jgi:protein-S-isoprenylcysteine O-methyltransferase Ste14
MVAMARAVVVVCWGVFFAFFIVKWMRAQRGRTESGRRTNPGGRFGIVIEALAVVVVFAYPGSCAPLPGWTYAAACAVAVAAVLFGCIAGVHLGDQLRVQAVVTQEHRLITSGPYSVVRHPIYTSVLGLTAATALAFACPPTAIVSVALSVTSTEIRVRAEDALLASHFGPEFERYRSRVKAYIPGLR